MSKLFQHKCVKATCDNTYQSKDEDAYFCNDCQKEKNAIAKQIDARFAHRPSRQPESIMATYDKAEKIHGFPNASQFL